jgi:hypothetical protein
MTAESDNGLVSGIMVCMEKSVNKTEKKKGYA